MTTAKRSQQLTFGKPSVKSVLEISDINLDYELKPNFVQIEARALSLNPIDYKLITGGEDVVGGRGGGGAGGFARNTY